MNGDIKTVRLILNSDIDVNSKNKNGVNALIAASNSNHTEIVKLLLEHDGDPNSNDSNLVPLLINATANGNTEMVKILLDCGANPNLQNKYGDTVLIGASMFGKTEIVKLLLEFGVNVNLQNNTGNTALMYASENGHTEIVKLLLQYGADVNLQNNKGKTTLMIAADNGHTDIVKLLSIFKKFSISRQPGKPKLRFNPTNKLKSQQSQWFDKKNNIMIPKWQLICSNLDMKFMLNELIDILKFIFESNVINGLNTITIDYTTITKRQVCCILAKIYNHLINNNTVILNDNYVKKDLDTCDNDTDITGDDISDLKSVYIYNDSENKKRYCYSYQDLKYYIDTSGSKHTWSTKLITDEEKESMKQFIKKVDENKLIKVLELLFDRTESGVSLKDRRVEQLYIELASVLGTGMNVTILKEKFNINRVKDEMDVYPFMNGILRADMTIEEGMKTLIDNIRNENDEKQRKHKQDILTYIINQM